MWARHFNAREATSSESESRGTSLTALPDATAPKSLLLANCRRVEEEEEEDDDFAAVCRWSCSGEVVNMPDDDEGKPDWKDNYCNECMRSGILFARRTHSVYFPSVIQGVQKFVQIVITPLTLE